MSSSPNDLSPRRKIFARSAFRDLLVPGILGIVLHSTNLAEIRLAIPPLVIVSKAFLESGLVGLALVSFSLGLLCLRPIIAWTSFFLPAYILRTVLGMSMVIQGTSNIWPLMFVGDTVFGILALILFVAGRSVGNFTYRKFKQA